MQLLIFGNVLVSTSCVFGAITYSVERTITPTSTIFFPSVGNCVYNTSLDITNVCFEGFQSSTYFGK